MTGSHQSVTPVSHWLYRQIKSIDPQRTPQEALQSTVNWARALALEIAEEHGRSAADQFQSCLKRFRRNSQGGGTSLGNQAVFEPLFSSLTNALSLTSKPFGPLLPPWTIPGAIVEWYYAHYMAVRSMLAAAPVKAEDKHASVIKAFGASLRTKMPHPLNTVSKWVRNEEFSKTLPQYPGTCSTKLTGTFSSTRSEAREMLLGYLSGTTKREIETVKVTLAAKHRFADFRKKEARALRDRAIENREFNFMHCAFRYRGKANYRDAIYLVYGSRPLQHQAELIDSLALSSRFVFVCALAFVRLRLGKQDPTDFVADLSKNLRGFDAAKPEEKFWQGLL